MAVDKHKIWIFLIVMVIITAIISFNSYWPITGQAHYDSSGTGSNTKYKCPGGEILVKSSVYRGEEGWGIEQWGCCQYQTMCAHGTSSDNPNIQYDYDVPKEYSPHFFKCFSLNSKIPYLDNFGFNGYTFVDKSKKEIKVQESEFYDSKNPYNYAKGYCGPNNIWYECFPKTGNYIPSDFPQIYCYNSIIEKCVKDKYGQIIGNALCFYSNELNYYWSECNQGNIGITKSILGSIYLCNGLNWIKGEEGNISGNYVYHNFQWVQNKYCKSCKKGEKCIFSDEYLKNLFEPIYSVLQTAEKTGKVGCSSGQQCIDSNHKAVAYDTVDSGDKQMICGAENRWLKCTTNNKGVFSDSGKFICGAVGWAKKVKPEICYGGTDEDDDGDVDCKDSECKGLSVGTGKCITSSIKNIGAGGTLSDDANSLKPENLKKRSALCTKPTDCVNANGECIGYDAPYAASGGVFNCGANNIWKKCTAEGKEVKSDGGLFVCDGTKWKLAQGFGDIPFDKKEVCDNGKDDDTDLKIDCGDYTDCDGKSCGLGCLCLKKKDMLGNTIGAKKETICNDQADNDGDSKLDCDDADCVSDTACVKTCTSNCVGKTCGDDGCGGSCGSCVAGESCQGGNCVQDTVAGEEFSLDIVNNDGCVNNDDLDQLNAILEKEYDPFCTNPKPDYVLDIVPNNCVDNDDLDQINAELEKVYDPFCFGD